MFHPHYDLTKQISFQQLHHIVSKSPQLFQLQLYRAMFARNYCILDKQRVAKDVNCLQKVRSDDRTSQLVSDPIAS